MKKTKRFDGNIYQRANEAIASGALTNSKRPESFIKTLYPSHLKKGLGCYVWDTFDNRYIDFICGLGANLLGYAEDETTAAIMQQARNGASLSLSSTIEVKAAEKVKELFPFIERLRFLKTGSEATTASLIIARAHTNRSIIYNDGYHAWHPEFTSLTPPALGIMPHPFIKKLESINQIDDKTAAVIIEPVQLDFSNDRKAYLQSLQRKCKEAGTLLIFDEIITGCRFLNHSVSYDFDVIPDLVCLGKALANGMPISVVGGKKEIMENGYFVSSTFAGETLSLASCIKTIEVLQTKQNINVLWQKGAEFMFKFNEIWRSGVFLEGYPTRMALKAKDDLTKALFMQECCKANILIGPSVFFNFCHVPLIDEVMNIFKDILMRIQLGQISLEGEMPKPAYAQIIRRQ